ncbi:MAG: hypothetical protein OHK006_05720 [Thermodesulfovibrionales bacterium]
MTEFPIGRSGILEDGIDLIMKPFKPAALLRKIRGVLDRDPAEMLPGHLFS